ncbi:hypothetical protein M422DRAFT_274499 [Sphaerobolus stellatus SS14]|uniref:Uncharacterized protein n=1 Tax=Sphaerobolus stellatus (strain SS14) TaxID=990650 RepID=A0A0C9TRZ1_SPHS4|nr:hypothetical protein M422DRAFT_274499 [Sphaerobolus stellatus SS14]
MPSTTQTLVDINTLLASHSALTKERDPKLRTDLPVESDCTLITANGRRIGSLARSRTTGSKNALNNNASSTSNAPRGRRMCPPTALLPPLPDPFHGSLQIRCYPPQPAVPLVLLLMGQPSKVTGAAARQRPELCLYVG